MREFHGFFATGGKLSSYSFKWARALRDIFFSCAVSLVMWLCPATSLLSLSISFVTDLDHFCSLFFYFLLYLFR